MSESGRDQIAVTFNMTADDYARYFAIVRRRDGRRANFTAYILALFGAIPVALAFRYLALHWSYDSVAVDLAGRCSVFAFLFGAFTMVAAGSILSRMSVSRYLSGAQRAFESRKAVFDAKGLAVTGRISEASWQWAAVARVTVERGLLLIWVGQREAVAIPCRCFGSDDAFAKAQAFIRASLSDTARPMDSGAVAAGE